MNNKDSQDFDAFIGQTLNEYHDLSLSRNNLIPDFDNSMDGTIKTANRRIFFLNNRSLLAGAASIVIVLGLAVPALISWQGGSGTGAASKIKTTNNPVKTEPTKKDGTTYTTTSTTAVVDPVKADPDSPATTSKNQTATTKPKSAATTTATTGITTVPQNPTAAPVGFYAYTNEKYPGYWKVKFDWSHPSEGPGISYCVSDVLSEVQSCTYNSGLTETWQNITRDVGDTSLYTYYITAVTQSGVVSSVKSTTYAIPA